MLVCIEVQLNLADVKFVSSFWCIYSCLTISLLVIVPLLTFIHHKIYHPLYMYILTIIVVGYYPPIIAIDLLTIIIIELTLEDEHH